ncbi:class I SAM-dependent methyltransferase [uncultured Tateyamaria sp.]|uniref:class I SAM-dependent methyltransferase n=1 Tax=uncultured Tateyamaria sp. TaxID=455651 RepID=UPI002625EAD8|nr:class I SAM-dependent methyltransferase [uncultured Tateyamaria sp.]
MSDLDPLADETRRVYERHASAYDTSRSRALFEARWLARFAASLPAQSRVLDLGCGAGEPIARWFMAEGFRVTGIDYAEAMLDIARARWPGGDWRQADMRVLDLGETFDGIIAWNSLFHLRPEEQRICLSHLACHLAPGGSLLVTVGHKAGEVTGTVAGETVYHASLSPAGYATCLEDNGLRMTGFLAEDPETNAHSVLMARKDHEQET